MNSWIACGWYTPDYERWFNKLEQSLIEHRAPYDFRAVPKIDGGWERNTCRKAGFVLDALVRYPGKTVIFMDVDCVVTGNLGTLVNLPCDVALDFHFGRKRGRVSLVLATGHMVLNPTSKMRELMMAWAKTSKNPEFGLNDQETLTLAIGEVEDVCITRIGKTAHGTILHDCASKTHGVQKVNGHQRFKNRILSAFDFRKRLAAV